MESEPVAKEVAPPQPNGPSARQGCFLLFGGVALGFFGCLGGILNGSGSLPIASLAIGAVIFVVGIVQIINANKKKPRNHGDT